MRARRDTRQKEKSLDFGAGSPRHSAEREIFRFWSWIAETLGRERNLPVLEQDRRDTRQRASSPEKLVLAGTVETLNQVFPLVCGYSQEDSASERPENRLLYPFSPVFRYRPSLLEKTGKSAAFKFLCCFEAWWSARRRRCAFRFVVRSMCGEG